MSFDEDKLREVAEPYISKARAGDWEHALRVVKWVKELGEGRDDLPLIIAAAYIHDIGWSGVAPVGKMDFDELLRLEPKANENSARLIHEVLGKMHFTGDEIKTVERLVRAADAHKSEHEDEEIIVDADGLSKLCVEHLEQKYQPESYPKMIGWWEKEFMHRVKTNRAKELFPKLLSELKQEIGI